MSYMSTFLHRLWHQLTGRVMLFVKHESFQPGGLLEVRYMYIIVELVRMNSQAIRLCCTAIRPGYSYVDLVIQSSCLQTVWPAY